MHVHQKMGSLENVKNEKNVTLGRPHDPKTPQRCLAFDYYYNRCNRLQSIIKSRMEDPLSNPTKRDASCTSGGFMSFLRVTNYSKYAWQKKLDHVTRRRYFKLTA